MKYIYLRQGVMGHSISIWHGVSVRTGNMLVGQRRYGTGKDLYHATMPRDICILRFMGANPGKASCILNRITFCLLQPSRSVPSSQGRQ